MYKFNLNLSSQQYTNFCSLSKSINKIIENGQKKLRKKDLKC